MLLESCLFCLCHECVIVSVSPACTGDTRSCQFQCRKRKGTVGSAVVVVLQLLFVLSIIIAEAAEGTIWGGGGGAK